MIITIIDSIFNLTLFTKFLAFYSLPAPDSVLKWHYELSERITKMREITLITGASSGIGRETALYFSQKGHPVIIICNKNTEGLNELKSLIKGNNGIVESFIADVSSYEEMSDIFNILSQKNFLPDILVNNAGISHIGLLQDMTSDEWKHIIDVNLTSVFNCSKLIIPHMLSKNRDISLIYLLCGECRCLLRSGLFRFQGRCEHFYKSIGKGTGSKQYRCKCHCFRNC